MNRLKAGFPVFYLEIVAFILMATNKEKGDKLFLHFFPTQRMTEQEWAARIAILHEAANEMNFEEVQKVLSKVITAYKKAGGTQPLTPEVINDVVTECLRCSRNSAHETRVLNTFVQKVVEKANV